MRRLDWRARPARRRIGADYRLPMTSRIHTHVRHALHPPSSPRTPTRAFISAADEEEASYTYSYDGSTSTGGGESYSYESYESCAPLRLELLAP